MAEVGRPTKYKEEYATEDFLQAYIEFCKNKEELVSICGLAVYVHVCEDTIQEWKNKHEGFSVTVNKIRQISKNQLYNMGLKGNWNASIVKLGLSANHGMSEKTEQDITTKGTVTQIVTFGKHNDDTQ